MKVKVILELTVGENMRDHEDGLIESITTLQEEVLPHSLPSDLAQMFGLPLVGIDVDNVDVIVDPS